MRANKKNDPGYTGILLILLTQVTPRYSVRGRGRVPSDVGRVRGSVRDRGSLCHLPRPPALALRLSVPRLWRRQGVAPADRAVAVCGVWPAEFGHGGHHLSGHAHATHDLVSRHVVGDQSSRRPEPSGGSGPRRARGAGCTLSSSREDRYQRCHAAAGAGLGQLSGTGSAQAAADYLVGERDSTGQLRKGVEARSVTSCGLMTLRDGHHPTRKRSRDEQCPTSCQEAQEGSHAGSGHCAHQWLFITRLAD